MIGADERGATPGAQRERGRNPVNSDDFPQEILWLGWPYSVSAFPAAMLMTPESLKGSRFSRGGELDQWGGRRGGAEDCY